MLYFFPLFAFFTIHWFWDSGWFWWDVVFPPLDYDGKNLSLVVQNWHMSILILFFSGGSNTNNPQFHQAEPFIPAIHANPPYKQATEPTTLIYRFHAIKKLHSSTKTNAPSTRTPHRWSTSRPWYTSPPDCTGIECRRIPRRASVARRLGPCARSVGWGLLLACSWGWIPRLDRWRWCGCRGRRSRLLFGGGGGG